MKFKAYFSGGKYFKMLSAEILILIRLRSPKSNQFFVMSQLYIHENLVRLQPLIHKILCRQEGVMPMPTGSAQKNNMPPSVRCGDIKIIRS